MDYLAALDYIHNFDDPYQAAIRDHGKQTWGLARISALLENLNNPQLAYPVIHVAGTKGKGSVSALISQGLIESGLKTGLYISPHLEEWRERIQINREIIEEEALANLVSEFASQVGTPSDLSEFEITTALAFLHFRRETCDAAVIEVGLGGRLDATNVVHPLISVLTNISHDHMQLLGNTLSEIAGEKSAIIKDNVPVVSAPQVDEVLGVITRRAHVTHSKLTLVGRDIHVEVLDASLHGSKLKIGTPDHMVEVTLGLAGVFQQENAGVAYAALQGAKQQGLPVTDTAIQVGFEAVEWPGRMEVMSESPLTVIDSAHTPYSIGQLIASLKQAVDADNWTFVFGCMADKDIRGMLMLILPVVNRLVFTQAKNERAASPEMLLEIALDIIIGMNISTKRLHISLTKGVTDAGKGAHSELSKSGVVCYTGSLSIAGEARTHLKTQQSKSIKQ